MTRFLPKNLFLSALASLVAAASCLSPGSLDEETFRIEQRQADSSTPAFGDASPGCAEGCALLEKKCAGSGCHSDKSPAADLSLVGDDLVERLTATETTTSDCAGGRILVPGSLEQSVLFTKLQNPPECGERMPYGGELPPDEIDCIARWVLAPSCGTTPPPPPASPDSGTPDAPSVEPPGDAGSPPEPDAGPPPPPPPDAEPPTGGDETVWLEAEDAATLIAPMAIGEDAMASGMSYISAPTGSVKVDDPATATAGIASFLFDLEAGGTYKIFGRVFATIEDDDSFWVRVDDGMWFQWNHVPKESAWAWDDVHDSLAVEVDSVVTFPLEPGQHAVSVIYREAGGRLDKLAISNVTGFAPSGVGQ